MKSKQNAGRSQVEGEPVVPGGTKLKSERVQWHLQVPKRERRKFQAVLGGGLKIAGPLKLSFDLVDAGQAAPDGGEEADDGGI